MSAVPSLPPAAASHRERLPDERESVTHRFEVGEFTGYLTVGLSPDGRPLELFVRCSKLGSAVQGFCNAFAVLFSMSLQHGVPLKAITDKLRDMQFEPGGRNAPSIPAYICRWMEQKFL